MQVVNQARYQRCGRAMERGAEIAPSGRPQRAYKTTDFPRSGGGQ
jgi:hypothetical protein